MIYDDIIDIFKKNLYNSPLSMPYTFLSCDVSDRINMLTLNHRGSCHLTDIGTLAIHPLTLHGQLNLCLPISQKLLNLFKTLRRPAIPSDV